MDWKDVVKTVAPWIGTALGGPLGGLAVEAATQALGISEKTAEGLKNALAGATAADMLALKQADYEFQRVMQEMGYKSLSDLEAIAAGDRASARTMQTNTRSKIPAILSVLVTVGYFGILIGMMTGFLKVEDTQALWIMLGSLTTAWGAVMAFWFGTTRDSQDKTQLLAKAQPVK